MNNPIFSMKKSLKERLADKTIIGIYSGKGGVGKTTVASNLSNSLSTKNNVCLVDMDIDGSNVCSFLDINANIDLLEKNEDGLLLPYKYSTDNSLFSLISMSFFSSENPLIWRGPLLAKAVYDLLMKVDYSNYNILILDLPPGTSDVPLTIMQIVPLTGMVIVTTPHKMALLDAEKSIKMVKKMSIKVLGLIENMSGDIFGKGLSINLCERESISYLGSVSLSVKNSNGLNISKYINITNNIKLILKDEEN